MLPPLPQSPEHYSDARIAEVLLSNSVDEQDYTWPVPEVRKLGLDPGGGPHERPAKVRSRSEETGGDPASRTG